MSNPVRDQGREAKKLNLTEFDCPYGPGENRDDWMAGFGAKQEADETVVAPQPAGSDPVVKTGRKGKKGAATKSVVRPTGTGETSVVTTTASAAPEGADKLNVEVVIGDPSASTTRAETGGAGLTTGVTQAEAEAGALDDQPGAEDAR